MHFFFSEEMASAAFLYLSVEILCMIVNYLERTELLALCLTCGLLRRVAEPLLYARFEWTFKEYAFDRPFDRSFDSPIRLLLRTLMRRPQLARFIQTIHLSSSSTIPNCRRGDVHDMVDWIKDTGVPYSSQWIRALRVRKVDAFVALLLCRAPRLRSLYLGGTFACRSSLIGSVLRSCLLKISKPKLNLLPSFECLQNVTMSCFYPGANESRQDRNAKDVLTLLYLPSMKHINAKMYNPSTFAWPGTTPPDLSRLITLELEIVREEHLERILSLTSNLKQLRWEWFYRPDLEDEFVTDTLDFEKIAAALSHVSGTLVDLEISASCVSRTTYDPPWINLKKPFITFCDFDKLKRIEVPLVFLAGFSPSNLDGTSLEAALPRNVEWVTISDNMYDQEEWNWLDEDIFEHVKEWLCEGMNSTMKLQKLDLSVEEMHPDFDWTKDMTTALIDLGLQQGVVVDVQKFIGSQ